MILPTCVLRDVYMLNGSVTMCLCPVDAALLRGMYIGKAARTRPHVTWTQPIAAALTCLDLVVSGATLLGEALCCEVTLVVSPVTREGRPQPSAATRDGAAIVVVCRIQAQARCLP